jgi:sugar phosphate isomerase/epimerase
MTVFSYLRTSPGAAIPPQAFDLLGRAAARCRAAGVEMLIENSASCWGDTGAHQADLARAAGVRVTWDPANCEAAGQPAYPDGYAFIRDRVAHVHCKNWRPGVGNVPIAEGQADMAGQIAALLVDGYAGYFCIEPHQWSDRANATRINAAQLRALLADH